MIFMFENLSHKFSEQNLIFDIQYSILIKTHFSFVAGKSMSLLYEEFPNLHELYAE